MWLMCMLWRLWLLCVLWLLCPLCLLCLPVQESKDFVFLLSTRAGGLGINLATADTVGPERCMHVSSASGQDWPEWAAG